MSTRRCTVPEISEDEIRHFVQTQRQPFVIRCAGKNLEIVKRCSSRRRTADEEGVDTADGNSKGRIVTGIEWLAEQAGSTRFRVFVSRPAQKQQQQQRPQQQGTGVDNLPVSTFTLDGTDHPDAILTTSMSTEMTLEEMMKDENWHCRYMVEDDLGVTTDNATLQSLVPLRPPSPLMLQAYGNADSDDQSTTGTLREVKQRQLFVSFGPCQTQLHRDRFDNFYVRAFGLRHWKLLPPNESLAREAGSVSASISPSSLCSLKGADGSGLGVVRTTLHAGDAIFVPADHWHSVRSDSSSSVALNWYFEPL